MFPFVLPIGALLLLILDLGAIHFGVDSRDDRWSVDPRIVHSADTIRHNFR